MLGSLRNRRNHRRMIDQIGAPSRDMSGIIMRNPSKKHVGKMKVSLRRLKILPWRLKLMLRKLTVLSRKSKRSCSGCLTSRRPPSQLSCSPRSSRAAPCRSRPATARSTGNTPRFMTTTPNWKNNRFRNSTRKVHRGVHAEETEVRIVGELDSQPKESHAEKGVGTAEVGPSDQDPAHEKSKPARSI